jgi:hypothetical protein
MKLGGLVRQPIPTCFLAPINCSKIPAQVVGGMEIYVIWKRTFGLKVAKINYFLPLHLGKQKHCIESSVSFARRDV